jgi:molybdopterin-containing oxidoreductase family iron-sulfur binding subunit
MAKYGMVIDLDRCTGCRACMVACKVENNTTQASFWMYVFRFEAGEFPNSRVWFMPRPCMHCDNAPCVKACPVGARYKRNDGLTATDFDRCIGCRYCEVACPYGVNYFNWKKPEKNYYMDWNDPEIIPLMDGNKVPYANPDLQMAYGSEQRRTAGGGHLKGVMEKCSLCVHRLEQGLEPACVNVCPTRTIKFGDFDDPNSEVSRLLREKPSFRLLEELGTEPRVYYVGNQPPTDPATRQIEEVEVRV